MAVWLIPFGKEPYPPHFRHNALRANVGGTPDRKKGFLGNQRKTHVLAHIPSFPQPRRRGTTPEAPARQRSAAPSTEDTSWAPLLYKPLINANASQHAPQDWLGDQQRVSFAARLDGMRIHAGLRVGAHEICSCHSFRLLCGMPTIGTP